MAADPIQYDAFVSYRHAEPDQTWANWVVQALRDFRTPRRLVRDEKLAPRLGRIFQDQAELSAGQQLTQEILRRLEVSRFLIVVCSPRVRGREWIEREVKHFQDLGRGDRILPLLVDGQPDESLPIAVLPIEEALGGVEPVAADVRPVRGGSKRERKRLAVLRLAAPILGCEFHKLDRRERARRWRRRGLMAAAALVLLGVVWFFQQRAQRSDAAAKARRIANLVESGRQELRGGSAARALPFLSAAYSDGGRSPALRFLLARALRTVGKTSKVLTGHQRSIWYCAFSPSGTQVATASDDKSVRVWDVATGALVHECRCPAPQRYLRFAPDGSCFITGGSDHAVRVFDAKTGALRHTFHGAAPRRNTNEHPFFWGAEFLPGTTRFVCVGKYRATVIADYVSGWYEYVAAPAELGTPNAYHWTAATSPDGSYVVVGDEQGNVMALDPTTRTLRVVVPKASSNCIRGFVFAKEGRQLLVWSDEYVVSIFDTSSWERVGTLGHHRADVVEVGVDPVHGRVLTASKDHHARIFDLETFALLRTSPSLGSEIYTASLSPDRTEFVVAGARGTARIASTATGRTLATMECSARGVYFAGYSPDGSVVITAGADREARLWDVDDVMDTVKLRTKHGTAAAGGAGLVRGGREMAIAYHEGTLALRSASDGQHLRAVRWPHKIETAVCSPDGTCMALGAPDGAVGLWRFETNEIESLRSAESTQGAHRFAFFAGGRGLAAGSDGGALRVWTLGDVNTERTLQVGGPVQAIVVDPQDRRVAVSLEGGSIQLWDLAEGARRHELKGHTNHVFGLAFSPDGTRLASAGWEGVARLWDVERGAELAAMRAHMGGLRTCAFSADGALLVTGGIDNRACVWDATTGEQRQVLAGVDGHRRPVGARFHPTEPLVYTYGDQSVRVWDVGTGKLLDVHDEHQLDVAFIGVVDGGRRVLSCDSTGDVHLCDMSFDLPPPADVAAWLREHGTFRLSPAGTIEAVTSR